MPQFTFIANTASHVLLINQADERFCRLLAEFLTGNPDTELTRQTLIASKEMKGRLHLFDTLGERAYSLKHFFSQIPTNHHFLFIQGRCDDRLQIFLFLKKLADLDGTEIDDSNMERICAHLYENYTVKLFNGDDRVSIGVYEKSKRVCRFCGRSMPDVQFKQKAHAISESLGNKTLICREECDDCNQRFNKTIEPDIADRFRFDIILKGIKGKNGSPTLQGDEMSIQNDPSTRSTLGRDTLVLKVNDKMPDTRNPQDIVNFISRQANFSCTSFVPQNIYKCFCKYVLSLIDARVLPYFKGTIDWLNEPLANHQLPPVWHYQVPMEEVPSLVIIQRKNSREDIPYCWAIISIAGSQYLFILPFCSLDKHEFVNETELAPFKNIIHSLMPHVTLTPQQMNGTNRVKMEISLNFEIPPESVEGRDYYFVESSN